MNLSSFPYLSSISSYVSYFFCIQRNRCILSLLYTNGRMMKLLYCPILRLSIFFDKFPKISNMPIRFLG